MARSSSGRRTHRRRTVTRRPGTSSHFEPRAAAAAAAAAAVQAADKRRRRRFTSLHFTCKRVSSFITDATDAKQRPLPHRELHEAGGAAWRLEASDDIPIPSLPTFSQLHAQPASGGDKRMRLSLRGCPFSSPDGWPSADAASTSTGAARCAAMRSSRFDSSRATMPRATLMSVPLDTNSTNCSARFFSRCSRSLCLLRRWRLLGGFGGESPASAGSSVGATASVGFPVGLHVGAPK